MEYGEERAWWERTGERIYEKEEWKKIPTERFYNYAIRTLNMVSDDMPDDQNDWIRSNITNIPFYETYNPFATILGALTLDWKKKKIDEKRFKMTITKYANKMQVKPTDVLRYGRKWQLEWLEKLV